MGDGALSPTRSGHGARLRWGHGAKQVDYGDWKASLFANVGVSRSTNAKGAVFHDVQPLPELAELRRRSTSAARRCSATTTSRRLTPLSLAIWYMDDGGFTLRSKGLQERTADGSGRSEICVEAMSTRHPPAAGRLSRRHVGHSSGQARRAEQRGRPSSLFPTAETAKLHALIAPFVHPSMEYKLLPRYPGPVRGRAGVRAHAQRAGAAADHQDRHAWRRQSDPCTASTSRSRAPTTTSSTG